MLKLPFYLAKLEGWSRKIHPRKSRDGRQISARRGRFRACKNKVAKIYINSSSSFHVNQSSLYLFYENHVWIIQGGISDDLQKWWGDDRIVSGVDEDHRHLSWSVCCDRLLNQAIWQDFWTSRILWHFLMYIYCAYLDVLQMVFAAHGIVEV